MKFFKGSENLAKKNWEKLYRAIRKQEWHKALQSLEQLSKSDPNNPKIHLKTGDLLRRTGEASGAVSAYHRAASGLINLGFPHKAVAIYKIILRLSPDDREALEKSREIADELQSTGPAFPERITSSESSGPDYPEVEATPEEQPEGEPYYSLEGMAHKEPRDEGQEAAPQPMEYYAPVKGQAESGPLPEIFSFLTGEERDELIGQSEHRSFKDGEAVVEEGDSGDSIYVIKSGKANVVSNIVGEPLLLSSLFTGDFFGEVAFLTGRPRTASVIAEGDLEVMEINRDLLAAAIEKNPLLLDSLADFYHSRAWDTIRKVKGGQ